ncbi:DUF5999 family protein [Streptomyces aculeolatus]|uniref:DUF5999 family protein n=1 Tax=Streptomyces aculeolatus TaxID=270689 RepID=UPI001CECF252|nr:DUF5999 family protein [Streptomyces aculeolatus]
MCSHQPRCPGAQSPGRDAAKRVRRDWSLGLSRLCNGVYLFDDTGELLPDGRVISPRRPGRGAL